MRREPSGFCFMRSTCGVRERPVSAAVVDHYEVVRGIGDLGRIDILKLVAPALDLRQPQRGECGRRVGARHRRSRRDRSRHLRRGRKGLGLDPPWIVRWRRPVTRIPWYPLPSRAPTAVAARPAIDGGFSAIGGGRRLSSRSGCGEGAGFQPSLPQAIAIATTTPAKPPAKSLSPKMPAGPTPTPVPARRRLQRSCRPILRRRPRRPRRRLAQHRRRPVQGRCSGFPGAHRNGSSCHHMRNAPCNPPPRPGAEHPAALNL